ncbi:uncharacterized protein LOC129004163 [Macrosteles quadrilineatus]|uniref:uncharacterized protein LOC128987101 n=1 Tax=Macrosteles quadrilineatus TaxID=74068 RepID=UPI0023E2F0D1|nr:uncharacterized protein LOC128987101 [Macrosteles quadrilineatus]XP_054288588.1 uncharacterized protein LOC129004163 [Macrosteles quadrilineatus]
MNSKHLDDKNPLKRPLKKENSNVIKCLEDAIPYIASWSVVGSPPPPCFDGLKQTLHGVLSLFNEVFTDDESFLLTGRLNQDPLENLFGVLRRRSGYSSNPSAKEFRRNLQHSMSIRLMDPPSSANCEPDCDDTLVFGEEVVENSEASFKIPESEDMNKENSDKTNMVTDNNLEERMNVETEHLLTAAVTEEDTITTLDVSGLEDNVICYIAGWLGKKCLDQYSCTDCESTLLKSTETLDLNREQLIHFKTFTKHDGSLAKLCKPSDIFHKVVKFQSLTFAMLFPQIWSSDNLSEKLVGDIYKETEKRCCAEWWLSCKEHKLYLLKMLVKCKLFNCVKWKTNDLRDQALLKRRAIDGGKLNQKLKKLNHL